MPYATPYYQIAIDKNKITADLANFVVPIKISAASGQYPGYDIATPFFTELSSVVMMDNFESYGDTAILKDMGTGWGVVNAASTSQEYTVTSAVYYTGAKSIISTTAGAGTSEGVGRVFSAGGVTAGILAGAIRVVTNPAGGSVGVSITTQVTTSGSTQLAEMRIRPLASNQIQLYYNNIGASKTIIATAKLNLWYPFTVQWRQGTTYYEVYATVTDIETGIIYDSGTSWIITTTAIATAFKAVQLLNLNTSTAQTAYFDDIVISEATDYSKKFTITNQYGTELPIERAVFDSVNQTAYLFVKAETVSSVSDTKLYLWFDKTHADNALVGTTIEPATHDVWPSEYKAVYHLEDALIASGLQVKDSTVYQNDAQKNGALTLASTVTAFFNKGISFEGTSSYLSAATSAALQITGSFSICAAVRNLNITGTTDIISKWNTSGNNCSWKLEAAARKLKVSFGNPTTGVADYYTVTTDGDHFLDTSAFYVIGFSFEAGATLPVKIYINGAEVSSNTITGTTVPAAIYNATGATLGIAASSNGGGGDFFSGILDETMIVSGVMDNSWFRAIYHGLNDDLVRFNIVSNDMTAGYVYINPATTNPAYYPSTPTWNYATTGKILRSTVIPTLTGSTGIELINTVTPLLTGKTGLELINTVVPTLRAEVGYVTNSLALGYVSFTLTANMAEFYTLSASLPPLIMNSGAGASGAQLDKEIPSLDISAHAFRWEWANLQSETSIPALKAGEMFVGAILSSLHSLPALTISASAQINESAYLLATSLSSLSMTGNAFVGILANLNAKLPTLKSAAATSNDVRTSLNRSLPILSLSAYAIPQGFTYLSKSIPAMELTGFTYNNPLANLSASLPTLQIEDEDSYAYVAGRFDDYTLQYTR